MSEAISIVAAVTVALASVITLVMRRWAAQLGFVDIPNTRSSHLRPTARGGGVAIVIAFFCAVVYSACFAVVDATLARALVIGGGIVAIIGFIDDRKPLSAWVRFTVQGVAAFSVIAMIGLPETGVFAWGLHSKLIGAPLAAIAILWTTNLFNFMDGIDGIAASEATFVASSAAVLNYVVGGDFAITAALLFLSCGSIGFLIFNWPPASIFMGDVGSGFLGFSLAVLALRSGQSNLLPLEVWPILGAVFVVDATVTLIRRVLAGYNWREAHRTHAYQHLALRLGCHRPVTLLTIVVNVVWLFPIAWYAATHVEHRRICMIVALLPIIAAVVRLGAGEKKPKVE